MTNDELLDVYPLARITLIEARRARGITQRSAAMKLDVSWPYYRRIELGEVTPEPWLAEKITKLFEYEWEET